MFPRKTAAPWSLAVVVLLALAPTLTAQDRRRDEPRAGIAGGWRQIGDAEAGFRADHDTIRVDGDFDDFRRIKFKVTGADLNITKMVVTYNSGGPDEIEVAEKVKEGGESRQIDLRGQGARAVRKIEFWYDTNGVKDGRAKVTVFGMK